MGFLKRLSETLTGASRSSSPSLYIYVRCKRCGEAIATRVNLYNEPSIEYDDSGRPTGYHVRKVLVGGTRRCYQPVEVHLTFDSKHGLVDREVSGGEFITAEEFAAASKDA